MPWARRLRFDENLDPFLTYPKRKKRRVGQQPIIHRERYVNYLWPLDPSLKNKFKKPKNLTVVTAHNYPEKSIFEQSLDYLGIVPYVVLKQDIKPWSHRLKMEWLLEFLQSGRCRTEYLLFCDARDTIIFDDLHKVLDVFHEMKCELIFSSTVSTRGIFQHMPQLWEWTKTVARRHNRYLNSGVFIGRSEFIQKFYEAAVTLFGRFPRPEDDQDIFRYLHPAFYPEMDLDYFNEISYRN